MTDESLEIMRMKVAGAISALHKTLLSNPFPDIEALRYDWRAVGNRLDELQHFFVGLKALPMPEELPL